MKPIRRILLTNDDGVEAPGLAVAERIAAAVAEEVWVVAPMADQSGVGQGISMHHPLRVTEYGTQRYALTGTPADCVMVAMADWLRDDPPDLVLSGVNWGANLSDSVMYSGTVGAVLAADHLGIPAIALSQAFHDRSALDFSATEAYAVDAIRRLWAARGETGRCCWNLNFPMQDADTIQGLRFTRQSTGTIVAPHLIAGTDGRGLVYHWLSFERDITAIADPLSDVVALREGYVSATPLHGSRCDEALLEQPGLDEAWRLDISRRAE
ncbi:5'/3'-nucleotidase SurE [Salinisphaera sp.]|uniref:5'/3'-nucleotidase SurE n=1 Tax=Salinisphaera sp. TaxID=1914330 RepID=UPI000C44D5FA|nr:5'/3'-nucleotidase SurE [Salinisphaera sp.]MBS64434.1 5'/3'-nucleotidase SurE [Salinisphaera sp.]